LRRALIGLTLMAITLALLGAGVWRLMDAREGADSRKRSPTSERVHTVNVETFEAVDATAYLIVYGEIRSWRTLELRAPAAGRLIEMDEQARDGANVSASQLLFVIDPADPQARQNDAKAGVTEATTEVAEAGEAVLAAEQELQAAARQLALRRQSLKRQSGLLAKGYATKADIEAAQLSLASADQSVLNRSQMVITARKRVERASAKLERAQNTLNDAIREVGETRVRTPFAGLLTGVDATLGRLVGVNEKLADVIDPTALEAVFRVSNRQFARLVDARGKVVKLRLRVGLRLGEKTVFVPGVLDRVDAVVGAGQSGRLMFARLQTSNDTVLRPGDFVTVEIEEVPLQGVADVPATAVSEDGRVLVLADDGRLREARAVIARRQGERIFLRDVPFGTRYVTERLPQLGAGVRVRASAELATATSKGDAGSVRSAPSTEDIALEPGRRERLVKAVTAAKRMPAERRARMLEMLARERVPKRLVERIEQRLKTERS
jgi:membrane fusion protein, multidrug efflux system